MPTRHQRHDLPGGLKGVDQLRRGHGDRLAVLIAKLDRVAAPVPGQMQHVIVVALQRRPDAGQVADLEEPPGARSSWMDGRTLSTIRPISASTSNGALRVWPSSGAPTETRIFNRPGAAATHGRRAHLATRHPHRRPVGSRPGTY